MLLMDFVVARCVSGSSLRCDIWVMKPFGKTQDGERPGVVFWQRIEKRYLVPLIHPDSSGLPQRTLCTKIIKGPQRFGATILCFGFGVYVFRGRRGGDFRL